MHFVADSLPVTAVQKLLLVNISKCLLLRFYGSPCIAAQRLDAYSLWDTVYIVYLLTYLFTY